jgi:hypothetical protein
VKATVADPFPGDAVPIPGAPGGSPATDTVESTDAVPDALLAVTLNDHEPAVVGVPASTPVDDSVSPGGNAPVDDTDGAGVPPVTYGKE